MFKHQRFLLVALVVRVFLQGVLPLLRECVALTWHTLHGRELHIPPGVAPPVCSWLCFEQASGAVFSLALFHSLEWSFY